MDNKGKLLALMIAGALCLSGCGAQATEPVNTTKSPVSSEPVTSSESVSIGEVNYSNTTLSDLTENHLAIFNIAISGYPERIKSGSITVEQGDAEQDEYISIMVMENELPENGMSLFVEWKESSGYYDQFKDIKQPELRSKEKPAPSNSNSNQQNSGSQSNQNSSQSSGGGSGQTSKPSGGTSIKPQPSTDQQQEQAASSDEEIGIKKPTQAEIDAIDKEYGATHQGEGLDWSLWE